MTYQLWRSFTIAIVISGMGNFSCMANAIEGTSEGNTNRTEATTATYEVAQSLVDTVQAAPPNASEALLVNWGESHEGLHHLVFEETTQNVSNAPSSDRAIDRQIERSASSPSPSASDGQQAYVLPPATLPKPDPTPEEVIVYSEQGMASWYGPGFEGNLTANGEIFNSSAITAAHPELPFGTQVRVTNLDNGRSLVVRVNDRGPYAYGRVIDLSAGAAERLGLIASGVAPVRLEVVRPAEAVGK
ncbi:Rare lipoprotein A precursor [Geitlerinema sp. FC II]|uniref:septal ring lytic transglycosylase RlpA family protein n=1 Tax=Baaleninema simplex TaxID=2862350 RepID=UPI000349A6F6|nr:septal ring lytic transglycosylase RlpA family protein [Baaleninema simplex]MDC0833640.1 septal ring lytic transglycosylase RlpA family protein [Geitlerinema sp. CS-897]PPT10380.1 Rare lipoprotein A precursor [Geitlerinema sp. FC II]